MKESKKKVRNLPPPESKELLERIETKAGQQKFFILTYDKKENEEGDPKDDIINFIKINQGNPIFSPCYTTIIFSSSMEINHWIAIAQNSPLLRQISVSLNYIGTDIKQGYYNKEKIKILDKDRYDSLSI